MDFYLMDLLRIISDITECCRAAPPDWERLEIKGQDLAVLARAAQKGSHPSQEHVDGIREEIMARLGRQFPGEHAQDGSSDANVG
ncbi:hypothetical protein ES703_15129 [subsurface metagenome]